jgi:hypothetical protein
MDFKRVRSPRISRVDYRQIHPLHRPDTEVPELKRHIVACAPIPDAHKVRPESAMRRAKIAPSLSLLVRLCMN